MSSEAIDQRMGALEADNITPAVALPAREGLLVDAGCRALDVAVSAVLLVVLFPLFR